ncbi:Cytochrome P450 89A9 [Linum grandiflorum]
MEESSSSSSSWIIITAILSSLISSVALLLLKTHLSPSSSKSTLPPGPTSIPIIGTFVWMLKSRGFSDLEPSLRRLLDKYNSILTIRIFSRPAIFIASHSLAHQALIQDGAVFADRTPASPVSKIVSSDQHNISSASYGLTWRLLRRNLTSQLLHPSRIRSFSGPRSSVLHILLRRLRQEQDNNNILRLKDHLHHAMFCLLVLMCFGDKLDEDVIDKVGRVQRGMLLGFRRFQILNLWPSLTRILLRNRWKEFHQLRHEQHQVLLPLIRARRELNQRQDKNDGEEEETRPICYVDSLLELEIPVDAQASNKMMRKLQEDEILALCSEFLDGGTDTTTTALEWIMANLVKHPHIQDKLFSDIQRVMGSSSSSDVGEEDLQRMPYLRAVNLEGLRRHPPGHFVLPHAVTHDTVLDGFLIPKEAAVNFMVAEMGWDPKVWEDPMAFKPERFLAAEGRALEFDLTGSKEIKMMPFGAGRRMCPGYSLAMLHLDYFVANLVWNFKWEAAPGDDVDLSEKPEFTVVLKHPLEVKLSPRITSSSV